MRADLKGMTTHEIEEWAVSQGLTPYRGRQIRHWMLGRLAGSFEEMTNLPKPLRSLLIEKANINHLENTELLESKDGTRKYLFRLADGNHIESVLIPERDHLTLCISSQAGCAMGCRFCFTAKQGFKRHLTSSEIIDQVAQVKRSLDDPARLTNIVMMGMGEPLHNYYGTLKAVKNLIDQDGMNFSHRKITLSTCGLVPEMEKMGKDMTVNLAVSLNAADDETRTSLMPVNKKFPLKTLMSACRKFPLPNRRMITFEYILIEGVNDSDGAATRLSRLLTGLRAKINLIPLNPHPGSPMAPPLEGKILRFQKILLKNNYTAIVRKSKGSDILAACGQLSGGVS